MGERFVCLVEIYRFGVVCFFEIQHIEGDNDGKLIFPDEKAGLLRPFSMVLSDGQAFQLI